MLNLAEFDEVYNTKPDNVDDVPCNPPTCFVGSYAPVAPAGQPGPFYVNTYLLREDRKQEVAGTTAVRSADLNCKK